MQGGREKDDTRVYDVDVCLIIGVVLRKGGDTTATMVQWWGFFLREVRWCMVGGSRGMG